MAAKKTGKPPAAYVESFDGKNLALNLGMDNFHFSFNLRDSIFDNANRYYERGKRAKEKAQGALFALQDSKRKLAKIERELAEAEELKSLKPAEMIEALSKRKVEMENKEWYEKFRWYISSDGFLVVAGKDTVSNEVLIKKYTSQEDVVFHAEITGSPFVVIKAEGKPISEQALREAGEFAASFSRAWRENLGTADVYWVKVDQLSKSGPSGESVPHGAFFVVGKRNWYTQYTAKSGNRHNRWGRNQLCGWSSGSGESKNQSLRGDCSRRHSWQRAAQTDSQIPNAKAAQGTAGKSRQNID